PVSHIQIARVDESAISRGIVQLEQYTTLRESQRQRQQLELWKDHRYAIGCGCGRPVPGVALRPASGLLNVIPDRRSLGRPRTKAWSLKETLPGVAAPGKKIPPPKKNGRVPRRKIAHARPVHRHAVGLENLQTIPEILRGWFVVAAAIVDRAQ